MNLKLLARLMAIASLQTVLGTFFLVNSARAEKINLAGSNYNPSIGRSHLKERSSKQSCTVSGRLSGPRLEEYESLYILPFDSESDEPLSMRASVSASNSAYRFSSLPRGRYVLRVFRNELGSRFPVKTYPRQRTINCTGNTITNVDFELE